MKILLVVLLFSSSNGGLLPTVTKTDEKSRVLDLPLSNEEHFVANDEKHNVQYDHEAFLGSDQAKQFEKLTPEESKKRLGILFDRIDRDKNGSLTVDELRDWIKSVQTRYITLDVDRQWSQLKNHSNDQLSWEEYDKHTFFALHQPTENPKEITEQFLRLQKKDRRRFLRADEDKNNFLSKKEFSDFIHPEQSPRMKDLIITETIEDIDQNQDGLISLEEYINDLWQAPSSNKTEEEPSWIEFEKENFKAHRDLNNDGRLNREEVEKWLIPTDYDHVQAETAHLFHEADRNSDNQLSKEEILEKYQVFVGSQATDWGAELTKHDDL